MGKTSKNTAVILVCPQWGYERKFSVEHAENLISMRNNGGWELPKNSEYEYIDGSIIRRNKKQNKRTAETFGNQFGDFAPEQNQVPCADTPYSVLVPAGE